jgi:hypothetical protein
MFFKFLYKMQEITIVSVESYDYKIQYVFICLCSGPAENRKHADIPSAAGSDHSDACYH